MFTRPLYRSWLIRRFNGSFKMQTTFGDGGAPAQRSEVIDSYVVEHQPETDDDED